MRFPLRLSLDLARHIAKNRLRKNARFPLVLMLEPTHLCNCACSGCGRIREFASTLTAMLSLEDCLKAMDECPAPVVTITGGEPLLYPPLPELLAGALARKRHIQLCTNGLLLEKALPDLPIHPNLTLNVHIDGLAATHDRIIGLQGGFSTALAAVKTAKMRGLRVCTNTTIFRDTDLMEIEMLFSHLTEMGVDGLLVAPGFDYTAVSSDLFLQRQEIQKKFQQIYQLSKRFRFWSTPPYLRFLTGEIELRCTPWGSPTRNPHGWKAPCYLITDHHYSGYREMMTTTEWERYGVGNDPRCAQCMMHCGFEPTVVNEIGKNWHNLWEMIVWNLT